MDDYIRYIIPTLYPFVDDKNTPYLTKEELEHDNMLTTNCGINSDIIFNLLKRYDISDTDFTFTSKIADLSFDTNSIYKIYNLWDQGHSHVAVFYFYDGQWVFVESSENREGISFAKQSQSSLTNFLLHRENISVWQEICSCPVRIDKVNIVINKSRWIEHHHL